MTVKDFEEKWMYLADKYEQFARSFGGIAQTLPQETQEKVKKLLQDEEKRYVTESSFSPKVYFEHKLAYDLYKTLQTILDKPYTTDYGIFAQTHPKDMRSDISNWPAEYTKVFLDFCEQLMKRVEEDYFN